MDIGSISSLAMAEDIMEETNLLNELMQGKELANQLQLHLNSSSSFSHREKGELLVRDILKSYENALSILLRRNRSTESSQDPVLREALEMMGSKEYGRGQEGSKKRKNVIRWTKKVRIGEEGDGGGFKDGYNWRKYGQKDIHRTNFPRNYFRCTKRNTQGCLATKHVQRSDEDPTLFLVSYQGSHSCNNIVEPGPIIINNNSISSTETGPLSEPPINIADDPKVFPAPNTLFEQPTSLLDTSSTPVENNNALSTAFLETDFTAAGFDYFSSGFLDESELSFTFDNSRFFD